MPRSNKGYEALYREFGSPLMGQIRQQAYGEDIGQHSWVDASEVRAVIELLSLSPSSRLLDLGCGPCGPLTFILATVGCSCTGLDLSRSALQVGRERAAALGVDRLLSLHEADFDQPLPFESARFEAVMALDTVLHVRDRELFFDEVARVLEPGGRFLFTDGGVITGPLSNQEVRKRSPHGYTQFVPAGWNERLLQLAGFQLVQCQNRTGNALTSAHGRLAAMQAHRCELERISGVAAIETELEHLETVVELSRREALTRMMYLAVR